jgi:hypothetical protein
MVADNAFRVLASPPAPLAFDGRGITGLPDRHLDLIELRDLLTARRLPRDVEDVVWRQLVVQARQWGPAWVVAATGIAAPGLARMAARLKTGHRGLGEDIESEMVTGFLGSLRRDDVEAPRVWLRLMWAAWRAGDRARRVRQDIELLGDVPDTSRVPKSPYGHPDLILGRAVALGILSRQEAELIGDTRLGEALVEVIADARGVSAAVLRMRRHRSEQRLVAAIRDGRLADIPTRPIPRPGTSSAPDAAPDTRGIVPSAVAVASAGRDGRAVDSSDR